MQKGTEAFSEMEDDGFENDLLDALAQERSAIEEIEQEKEEHSFREETVVVSTSKKKLWRDTQKEALARLEDSARTEEDFRNAWRQTCWSRRTCGRSWRASGRRRRAFPSRSGPSGPQRCVKRPRSGGGSTCGCENPPERRENSGSRKFS